MRKKQPNPNNRIFVKFRAPPKLVAAVRAHARRWGLTDTSVWEHAGSEFLSVPRRGLLRIEK